MRGENEIKKIWHFHYGDNSITLRRHVLGASDLSENIKLYHTVIYYDNDDDYNAENGEAMMRKYDDIITAKQPQKQAPMVAMPGSVHVCTSADLSSRVEQTGK